MRIFLAEDETAIASFLKEGLEEEGFAVDVAFSGREALEMAMTNLNKSRIDFYFLMLSFFPFGHFVDDDTVSFPVKGI